MVWQRRTIEDSMEAWKRTLDLMGSVCHYLANEDTLAWLRPLSTLSASASSKMAASKQLLMVTRSALMEELLRLRLAVYRARAFGACSLEADGDALVRDFSALRHECFLQPWDPRKFMSEEVEAYGRALAALLTQKWCKDDPTLAGMLPEAVHILHSLLSLPKGVERLNPQQQDDKPDVPDETGDLDAWRPLVLAMIWATEPGRLDLTKDSANRLLLDGLKQVEYMTLRVMLSDTCSKSKRPRIFGAMTAKLLEASSELSMLKSLLKWTDNMWEKDSTLIATAMAAMKELRIDASKEKLLKDLYLKDLYITKNGLRARSSTLVKQKLMCQNF